MVTPGWPALIRDNSPEYSCVESQSYFQLSYYPRCFYSKRLRRILFSSSLLSALVSLRLSHISPCHLLPKHRKHTHTCAHSHTHMHACIHTCQQSRERSAECQFRCDGSLVPLMVPPTAVLINYTQPAHCVFVCVLAQCRDVVLSETKPCSVWRLVAKHERGKTERQRCDRFESVLLINMLSAVYVLLYLIAFQLTHLPFPCATVYTARPVKKKFQDMIGSHMHIQYTMWTHTYGMIR